MNAIGLQPRNPAPSVTSQGTQTPIIQLQNAETQTERDMTEPGTSRPSPSDVPPETPSTSRAAQLAPADSSSVQDGIQGDPPLEATTSAAASGPADSTDFGSGEDALARIRRLIAEGGMTAVVQREQSTTMASMGGFGNNIIVSHRIHRSSQTGSGASRTGADPSARPLLLTQPYPHHPATQASPMWGPQVLPGPRPPGLSVTVDVDDVFDGGRTDDDSLPGPSSSSSSSSHSPLPDGSRPNGYHGDPYSR